MALALLLGSVRRGLSAIFEIPVSPFLDHWLPAFLFSVLWLVLLTILVSTWRHPSSKVICISSSILMVFYFVPLALMWTNGISAFSGSRLKPFLQKPSSMEPTIRQNETIQVQLDAYQSSSPRRWDVVLFTPPMQSMPAASSTDDPGVWTFRVVGLPGDSISFDESGLMINGITPKDRPALIQTIQYRPGTASGTPSRPRSPTYPFTIPEGQYFVLGDNPDAANDSRAWGPLSREAILGKVMGK
ncbi:MAG: signal peptidase I [Chthoniobacterales bacterium]|nr:signal peptidase I [Chthoniobacterales bacterium]